MAKKKAVSAPKSFPEKVVPKGPFHFTGRRFNLYFTLSIIVGCFLIYGNSIGNGYSLDDEFVLHADSVVQKGVKGIPKLFRSRYAWDQKGSYGYRPIVKSTFAIEYQFFGTSLPAAHTINILMYALTVIALFFFLRKILYEKVSDYFLFIVCAIFMTHPLHSEVVDSLKNRDAMLSFLFGLGCTYCCVRAFETGELPKRIIWFLVGALSLDIGYLAKPDAIIFVAITGLVLYFFTTKKLLPSALTVVFLIANGIIRNRVAMRYLLPHSDYHRTFQYFEEPLLGTHWYQRFQLGFSSFWFYISKFLFPKDLICYYGYDEFHAYPNWTDITVLLGIVLTCATLWYLYKNFKEKNDLVLFSSLIFIGTLAAFVNVLKVGPGIVAERFMFIPSIGFSLFATVLLYQLFKKPVTGKLEWKNSKNILAFAGILSFVYSVRDIVRNPNWKTHLTVYAHDAKLAPRSAKLQSLLASEYIDQIKKNSSLTQEQIGNYYELAEQAFKASVDIYPAYTTSLNNVGMIEYMYYKNFPEALKYFSKAISYDSSYTEAWFNSAAAYHDMNNIPMAEKCYLQTIKVNPKYDMSYIFLSRLYTDEGKYDDILKVNEEALKNGHATDAIYINIGKVYLFRQDTAQAISYFDKALSYYSRNTQLLSWLENYYNKRKDTARVNYYDRMRVAAISYNQMINKQ